MTVQQNCLLLAVKFNRNMKRKQKLNIQVKIACCNTTVMCFSEISLGPYYLGSPSGIIIHW